MTRSSKISRREMLIRGGTAAGVAMFSPMWSPLGAAPSGGKTRKLVVLWLEGGPSQFETFDPKPGAKTGGPTKAIATDVSGWLFSENLPRIARRAQDLCVVRSMTSKEGNHSRARDFVKTGYVANPSVAFPSIGSIVASQATATKTELPGYVQINGAPSSYGYLGIEYAPFVVNDPLGKIQNLEYGTGVDAKRLDHRESMLRVLEDGFSRRGGDAATGANRSLRSRARRMMESRQLRAFDLDQEKEKTRDRYGRNDFGQACLLARRLLEQDVPAVEVVLGGWDTHDDNFARSKSRCDLLDPGFAALWDDLKTSGLAQETLVLCLGEFGRTPQITATDGRGHWPRNWCVAMAGAGIQGGMALGSTDEQGEAIVDRPVTVPDLYATVAHCLGFDADREYIASKRPITLVAPEGKVIREILG